MKLTTLWLMVALFAQEDLKEQIHQLCHELHSEMPEVREQAAKKLIALGMPAVAELEALAPGTDLDFSSRMRDVIERIKWIERIRRIQKPSRLVTVDLHQASLSDSLRDIFRPFGMDAKVAVERHDLGITAVDLTLNQASFWRSYDAFCRAAGLEGVLRSGCNELSFAVTDRHLIACDTLGEVRVFARSVMDIAGNISVRVSVAFPPWAVPKNAWIESSKFLDLDCEVVPTPRDALVARVALPWEEGKLTLAEFRLSPPAGGLFFKREVLGEKDRASIQGTLVLTVPGKVQDEEIRVPFFIRSMEIPPAPRK